MEYEQFLKASNNLKQFLKEQDKLNNVLKVISPTSTGVVEFGNEFIDGYINVVEIALGDNYNWFSWFIFENDFGAKKLTVIINDEIYTIYDEFTFFNICLKK